jgi:P-type Cu2+ transporter
VTCCPAPITDASGFVPDLTGEEARRWISPAGPGLSRIELIVPGADCAACIPGIEDALKPMPGVEKARLNLTARRVSITWRTEEAAPQSFIDRLAALGYSCRPVDPQEAGFSGDALESRRLLSALAVAGFAAANVMLLSVSVWSGADAAARDLFHWISAAIALPAIVYSGGPFFSSAAAAIRRGMVNMDVPISLGVLLAAGMSLFETIEHGEHAYFDAAVTLLFFLLAGRCLDHMMRARARSAISQLMTLTPATASIIGDDGRPRLVPAGELKPGMVLAVAAGERLAADGAVIAGKSELDCSHITGEFSPERAGLGSAVHAGALNLTGPLQVRITAAGHDTFVAEIARLLAAAEQSQSLYVRIADRMARYYSPTVHILAASTLLGWIVLGFGSHAALMAAISVLIITCPCALGLAVPATQVVASGLLFARGVMIKSGDALEKLAQIDTVILDKTGTLTLGRPVLINDVDIDDETLALAASLARMSRHPLSQALVRAAGHRGLALFDLADVEERPGEGLAGTWNGNAIRLGSRAFCGLDQQEEAGDGCLEIVLAGSEREPIVMRLEDQLRAGARAAIGALKARGLSVAILSGDREAAVTRVARELGIDDAHAAMSPRAKYDHIVSLRDSGRKVLMIGDGINDAASLAAGLTSMAPASASDIGRSAADIVLLGDTLDAIPYAHALAVNAQAITKQNMVFAIGYNLIAVPIAIVGLATPMIAAIAMSSSSLIVILNALRLRLVMRERRTQVAEPVPVLAPSREAA